MSDGGDGDREKNPGLVMRQIYKEHKKKGFICYTIGYGSGVDYGTLEELAKAGHGSVIQAPTAVDLKSAFDRLTVSEKIEKKAENISISECSRLLSKYMSRCRMNAMMKYII